MKKLNIFFKITIFLHFLAIPLLFNSCDKNNNTPISNDIDFFNTTVNIVFYDASTNQPIGLSDNSVVNINIVGADSSLVSDISGLSKTVYQSSKGFMTLGIKKDKIPTFQNPVKFTLVASSNNYVSTSYSVELTEEANSSIEIKMVSFNNPPQGVSVKVDNSVTASNGLVSTTQTITTPLVSTTNTKAVLKVMQNAIIKDENGNPLNGNLTTRVVYFNNQDEESLSSFPGGLFPTVNIGNQNSDVVFYSAGFVAIDIEDANGRKARTIENAPLQLEIEVNNNTYNPETDALVTANDSIPLWSYEPGTGEWNYEGKVIGTNKGGIISYNANLSHLSYYNFDWYGSRCSGQNGLNIKSTTFQNGERCNFILSAYRKNNNGSKGSIFYTYSQNVIKYDGTSKITFIATPSNKPVIIEAKDYYGNLIGTKTINNLCVGYQDFWLNKPSNYPSDSTTFELFGFCSSHPNDTIKPSYGFWYKDISNPNSNWVPGYMKNGKTIVKEISFSHNYRFYAYGYFYDINNMGPGPYKYSSNLSGNICNYLSLIGY